MNVVAHAPPRPELIAGARPTAIVPKTMDEAYRLAKAVVMSGIAPKGDTPEACMIKIMHGLEVGLPPLAALQRISVVNGRPTIWGDGAIGLVRGSGLCEYVNERIEGEGESTTAVCEVQRRGEPEPIVRTFSVRDAKRAGLWGKAGPWQQYPARMLTMRARGFALRDGFADVLGGMYLREELDLDEDEHPSRAGRGTITSGVGNKPGQLPTAKLTQPRPPQPTPSPQPIPPQPRPPSHPYPGDNDEPEPEPAEDDGGPPRPLEIGGEYDHEIDPAYQGDDFPGDRPSKSDERGRMLEAARAKALEGSRKLRFWRARLTPEVVALLTDVEWRVVESAAKVADAPPKTGEGEP